MSKTNKKPFQDYTRRDFLKHFGTAAGLAVPFLRSEVAMGQTTTAPTRLLIVPLAHGWGVDKAGSNYTGSESNFTLPQPLDIFQSIRNQCVFVDGIRTSFWGNAHDVSYSDILTCATPFTGDAAVPTTSLGGPFPFPLGPSLDWLMGTALNKDVLRLSASWSSWGAPFNPTCFDSSLRNLPFFTNAREAYNGIIAPLRQQQQQGGNPTAAANASSTSLLEVTAKDANRLLSRLAGPERVKMEGYINSLVSLRTRILNPASGTDLSNIVLPGQPAVNPNFEAMVDHYLEIIRVAFTLDTHRIAVLGLGEGITAWNWRDTGNVQRNGNTFGSDFHQDVAHYDKGPNYTIETNRKNAMDGWNRWYGQKIVNLVNTLSTIPDVDGRMMIENTLIVLCGEIGNGRHDRTDMTYILIGGGGQGRVRRNRWIATTKFHARNRNGFHWAAQDTNGQEVICPINYDIGPVSTKHAADLWVAIARLCGYNINSLGFSQHNSTPFVLT